MRISRGWGAASVVGWTDFKRKVTFDLELKELGVYDR